MRNKNKPYIPKRKFNPIIQAKKIEKLGGEIENHGHLIQAMSKSFDNHISHLGNFARHDIKNAIQNMDSILSTTSAEDCSIDVINALTACLDNIRDTVDNFAKLVPYSIKGTFVVRDLFIALLLLSRAEILKENVKLELEYSMQCNIQIDLPFQAVLQMINNLLINAIKSLENTSTKMITIKSFVKEKELSIIIQDNGQPILEENKLRIFDYGFSTTGGSGIGLFHAKYLCDQFGGTITMVPLSHEFTKQFHIQLPFNKQ